jgi:hypothetical protein
MTGDRRCRSCIGTCSPVPDQVGGPASGAHFAILSVSLTSRRAVSRSPSKSLSRRKLATRAASRLHSRGQLAYCRQDRLARSAGRTQVPLRCLRPTRARRRYRWPRGTGRDNRRCHRAASSGRNSTRQARPGHDRIGEPSEGRDGGRPVASEQVTRPVTRVIRGTVMAQVEIRAGPHRFVSLFSREAADEVGWSRECSPSPPSRPQASQSRSPPAGRHDREITAAQGKTAKSGACAAPSRQEPQGKPHWHTATKAAICPCGQ